MHLHVNTPEGDRYRIELYRLGYYGGLGARLLSCTPSCGGDEAGHSYGPRVDRARADWPVTDTLAVPADAVSGYYYALLRLTVGGLGRQAELLRLMGPLKIEVLGAN